MENKELIKTILPSEEDNRTFELYSLTEGYELEITDPDVEEKEVIYIDINNYLDIMDIIEGTKKV